MADRYKKPPFPFVCITGQDAMKRSLLVNAVDPAVGGVILLGDRGTGKSIAVKAMADIMPVRGVRHPAVAAAPRGAPAPPADGFLRAREPCASRSAWTWCAATRTTATRASAS